MPPENLAISTGTTFKQRFYDSNQPQNHMKEEEEGKEESEGQIKTGHTLNFYIADPHWRRSGADASTKIINYRLRQ